MNKLANILIFAAVVFCACWAAIMVDRAYHPPEKHHVYVCDLPHFDMGSTSSNYFCDAGETVSIIPAFKDGAK